MSLFGDIGNIFHSIGHFFNNGDTQQQQGNHPTMVQPTLPWQQPSNNNSTQWHPPMQAPQKQVQHQQQPQAQAQPVAPNHINLFQGAQHTPQTGSFDPNAPLIKAANGPQPNGPLSTTDRVIGTAADATARAAVGVPQAASQLWDQITPGKGTNRITKALNNMGSAVDQDQQQNGMQGRAGSDVYHGLQIAENVGAPVIGAVSKGADLVKATGSVGAAAKAAPRLIANNVVDKVNGVTDGIVHAGDAIGNVAHNVVDHLTGTSDESTALNKANTATDTKVTAEPQRPDEVATGLTSVNPVPADNAPAFQRGFGTAAPTQSRDFVLRQRYSQLIKDHPDQAPQLRAHLAELLKTSLPKNAEGEIPAADSMPGPGAAPATTPPETAGSAPVHQTTPVDQSPLVTQLEPTPPQAGAQVAPTATQTAAPEPVVPPQRPESSPVVSSQEPPVTPNNVEQTTNNVNNRTAPNAPNIRAQAQKDLDTASSGIDIGKAKEHEVLSNNDLNNAANHFVQSMSDPELVAYAGSKDAVTINNAGDIAKAYATIKRLSKLAKAGDKTAEAAMPDILDAVEKASSTGGRTINYVGGMLDNMPKEAQENYIVKRINSTRQTNGLKPLSDEEEVAARDSVQKYLTEIENKKDTASAAKGELDKIKEQAGTSTDPAVKQRINELENTIVDSTRQANQLNTEVGKQFAKIVGAKGNWAKSAGEIARGLMLTNPLGRLSDIATTTINGVHALSDMSGEAMLGKVLNKVTGSPGKFIDTMPSPTALVKGTRQGSRAMVDSYKGNVETPDLYSALKGTTRTGKAQMLTPYTGNAASRGIRNFGHAMAETATNLSEGAGNVRIQQLAMQEAKQQGLTGDAAKVYANATAAAPPSQMQRAGEKIVQETNNMNDNPLSDAMSKISRAFSDSQMGQKLEKTAGGKVASFVGEQIRNIVAPFTHWASAAAWNGATDKNAIANLVKIVGQLGIKDGRVTVKDSQELVSQIAKLGTNTVGATGAGYALASSGVLTTHNAEGYDDEGLYLHIGGHYIPAGFIGFFAPGVIMGWAAHQAHTDNGPGSMLSKVTKAAGGAFTATLRQDLNNSVLGGNNEFIKRFQEYLQNKNGTTGTDVAATAAGEAAGSYVPGIFGAANNVINSTNGFGTGLNPNHEAGLTKVTKGELGQTAPGSNKPSTATDIPHTVFNQLLNKVPGLGQIVVPRNPGVAAPDVISGITRGDNASADQAHENTVIDQLPVKQQQAVRNSLKKTNGAAQIEAQKSAQAAAPGPNKVQAQQVADKLAFTGQQGPLEQAVQQAQTSDAKAQFGHSGAPMKTIGDKTYANIDGSVQTFDNPQKAQEAIDKSQFTKSKQDVQTINGKTWANINGTPKAFDTPIQAKQAVDYEKFKASGKTSDSVDGMHFEKGSDGKPSQMEQKDYDYKMANDQITSAKNSGDVSGYIKGHQDLLDNISWQLNHADLTDANRAALTQKAVQLQEEYAKTVHDGGFSTPKGVPAYSTPTITGAKQYTPEEQKANGGYHDYTEVIQHMGAKYGLDINALLSVAAQEGLNGGVGDGGHAFGPFQMNDAGGVLTGKFSDPAKARAYAESPQGIEDAIKQIKAAVGNKTGEDAVRAIVTGFERPADPAKEIANALALYNGGKATLAPAGDGSTGISSLTPSDSSSSSAASEAARIRENKIGSLPALARESFIENGMTARPVTPNIPQIKLTDPETLIKAHKITVGMPKA